MSPDHLVLYNDQLWIADYHLAAAGYTEAHTGTVFRVGYGNDADDFYEVNGPAKEAGTVGTIEGWWVTLVEWEGWVPDAPPPK